MLTVRKEGETARKEAEDKRLPSVATARTLIAKLPLRQCSPATHKRYAKNFRKMWQEKPLVLDPLRRRDALDTFYVRRAALHYWTPRYLAKALAALDAAAERCNAEFDPDAAADYEKYLGILDLGVRQLAPAIERDPPCLDEVPDFARTSRWKSEAGSSKIRAAASKKHVLGILPPGWIAKFWQGVPVNHKDRDAIAALCVSPARPGEVVPGDRPSTFSKGVHVALDDNGCLILTLSPQKTHNGKYGMEKSGVIVDPEAEGPSAMHLAQRCREEGGEFVVKVKSAGALSKAIKRIGRRVFPDGPSITASVLRHQRLADAKCAFGAGEKVALAAGHRSDRTQSKYGNVAHGRRGGLIDAFGSRKPRLVAVPRARALGDARKNQLRYKP